MACAKRPYESAAAAKAANRKASFRFRAYYCAACRAWHVTNAEKRTGQGRTEDR